MPLARTLTAVAATVVLLTSCASGGESSGSGTLQPSASASASPSPSPSSGLSQEARAKHKQSLEVPAPKLVYPARPGEVILTTGAFTDGQVNEGYVQYRVLLDLLLRNPTWQTFEPKTKEDFEPILAMSAPGVLRTLNRDIPAYLGSTDNGGVDDSKATQDKVDELYGLLSILFTYTGKAVDTNNDGRAQTGTVDGTFDPAGYFGPARLSDMLIFDGIYEGTPVLTVLGTAELTTNLIDAKGKRQASKRTFTKLRYTFEEVDGQLKLAGWGQESAKTTKQVS